MVTMASCSWDLADEVEIILRSLALMSSFLLFLSLRILRSSGEALSAISSSVIMADEISCSSLIAGSRSELISAMMLRPSGMSSEVRKAFTVLDAVMLFLTCSRSLMLSILPREAIDSIPSISPISPTGILPLYRITETASVVSVNASSAARLEPRGSIASILFLVSSEPACSDRSSFILLNSRISLTLEFIVCAQSFE